MEEILHHLECFFGTLWTLGNFPCQCGDRTDFQTINRIHVKYCCCISFILSNLFPIIFQTFFPIPFTQKSTKIKNLHPLLLFYCTFFCSAHLFFPNKKLPPILWTFGLWALRALSLETRCQLWRPFRDFQTTRIHGKKGENFMKMI